MSDRPTHPRGGGYGRGGGGGRGRGHYNNRNNSHNNDGGGGASQGDGGGGGGGGGGRGGHHHNHHNHHHRGGRGGRGGGGGGGGSGGGSGEKPRKENILDLSKYMDKRITVKFNGGREVNGELKGFDALMNLVLDDVQEVTRDDEGNKSSRALGLVVARGTLLVLISPVDGSEVIENPFAQQQDAAEKMAI